MRKKNRGSDLDAIVEDLELDPGQKEVKHGADLVADADTPKQVEKRSEKALNEADGIFTSLHSLKEGRLESKREDFFNLVETLEENNMIDDTLNEVISSAKEALEVEEDFRNQGLLGTFAYRNSLVTLLDSFDASQQMSDANMYIRQVADTRKAFTETLQQTVNPLADAVRNLESAVSTISPEEKFAEFEKRLTELERERKYGRENNDAPPEKEYECDVCERRFKTSQGLGSHKSRNHSESSDESETPSDPDETETRQ